ncbi:MAG: type III pantothenate kinase [Planctomycetota bacterium]
MPRRSQVIITIDAGNTHVSIAQHAPVRARIFSKPLDELKVGRTLSAAQDAAVRACVISSVVPKDTKRLAALWHKATGERAFIFPRDFPGILTIKPQPAERVGADRLANALGALCLLNNKDIIKNKKRATHAVIVDVGTAVTVDVVSRARVFEGGMIAPGPRLGAKSLATFTAQLPEVKFKKTRRAIGRSTHEAIASGLWFGFRGLVISMVRAALAEFPASVVFVAGGDGEACLRGSNIEYIHQPDITHLGLAESIRWKNGGGL